MTIDSALMKGAFSEARNTAVMATFQGDRCGAAGIRAAELVLRLARICLLRGKSKGYGLGDTLSSTGDDGGFSNKPRHHCLMNLRLRAMVQGASKPWLPRHQRPGHLL